MQHIGKALRGFIKNSGLEKVLDQQSLIDSWEDVVGEKISKNTKAKSIAAANYLVLEDMSFNNRTGEFGLYVKLSASDSAVDIIIK